MGSNSAGGRLRRTAAVAALFGMTVLSVSAALAQGAASGTGTTAPAAAAPAPWETPAPLGLLSPVGPLGHAKSWGYQLQAPDAERLSQAPYDVLVVDYSRNGQIDGAFSGADVARMKARSDGPPRLVLAYLSIGEAEDYRFYWKRYYGWLWGLFGPAWLGRENREWRGNYAVRYWLPSWAQIIYAGDNSYLDRIVAAGFDGVYLDKIDGYDDWPDRASARADMAAFVTRLAERARQLKPGFLIVPQNGDELLADPAYRGVIDGIGRESLLYGEETEGNENAPEAVAARAGRLKLLTGEGKPVLAVEYLDRAAQIASARATLESLGFVPHFASRALDHMRFGDLPEPGEGRRVP